MLTANPAEIVCHPNVDFLAGTAFSVYSPAQIRHAYGFDQVGWNGAGQTIAIVDAYDAPTVAADLHTFDVKFGLTDPKLTVAKMTSGGRSPAYNAGWSTEIALDVEWAHAVAPGANILLVEAVSSSLSDLLTAVNYARSQPGVSVISMSWGAGEFSGEGSYDSYFTTPAGHTGVTFVASSGDNGAPASWPSISTNVLSVGGTSLTLGSGGTYVSEKGWSGSGGGYSPYVSEPSYQRGVQSTGHRSNPDVSYDADPYSGFYVCQKGSWYAVGGTSAGAPQWAGLIAVANQGRAAAGRAPLSSALQAIYGLAAADFHDITVGSNGYKAGVGYDAVTGRGSPIVSLVVRDLVAYGTTTTAPASTVGALAAPASTTGRMVKAVEMPTDSTPMLGGRVTTAIAASASGFGGGPVSRALYEPVIVSLATGSRISLGRNATENGVRMSVISPEEADAAILNAEEKQAADERTSGDSTRRNTAVDPLAAIDRIERLINDCLESSAAFGGQIDQRMDDAKIDHCLADPKWLEGFQANQTTAGTKSPAQLAAMMASLAGGAIGLAAQNRRQGSHSKKDRNG